MKRRPEKYYQDLIHRYCVKCHGGSVAGVDECKTVSCPFWYDRMGTLQMRLFDAGYREQWYNGAVEYVIACMPNRFWFSEFRVRFEKQMAPAHCNWWGQLSKQFPKFGIYRTEHHRSSPVATLRGSDEYLWAKKQIEKGVEV